MIEVENWLPKQENNYTESAVIACALKNCSVHLILFTLPGLAGAYHQNNKP